MTNIHYITPSESLFTVYRVTWLPNGDCDFFVLELHVTSKSAQL